MPSTEQNESKIIKVTPMKHTSLTLPYARSFGWCTTLAVAVGLSASIAASALGQAFYEQRFNDSGTLELKDGAALGEGGSGVSSKPEDKAYSVDVASAPKASAVIRSGAESATAEELTITAWYKPRAELAGPVTLFNAFSTLLIWEPPKKEWTWRVGAKPVDPNMKNYWFYSGKPPLTEWAATGEWTFIAMVWKKTGQGRFYQGSKTSSVVPAGEMSRGEAEPIMLGAEAVGTIGNDPNKKDRAFNGEIDNLRVFAKALDDAALEKLRQADLANTAVKLP
jgi:hypothetical protein